LFNCYDQDIMFGGVQ